VLCRSALCCGMLRCAALCKVVQSVLFSLAALAFAACCALHGGRHLVERKLIKRSDVLQKNLGLGRLSKAHRETVHWCRCVVNSKPTKRNAQSRSIERLLNQLIDEMHYISLYRQMIANTMIDTNQLCLLQLLFHISLQPALTALLHTNSHPKQGVRAGPWKGSWVVPSIGVSFPRGGSTWTAICANHEPGNHTHMFFIFHMIFIWYSYDVNMIFIWYSIHFNTDVAFEPKSGQNMLKIIEIQSSTMAPSNTPSSIHPQ